jgi:hypothetical protein
MVRWYLCLCLNLFQLTSIHIPTNTHTHTHTYILRLGRIKDTERMLKLFEAMPGDLGLEHTAR